MDVQSSRDGERLFSTLKYQAPHAVRGRSRARVAVSVQFKTGLVGYLLSHIQRALVE